ncbi:MAG: hypothetical protein O2895_05210, partial [Chloroflexi bacterium]|nr:hypothetical protein [Chloroflexota bacterium]
AWLEEVHQTDSMYEWAKPLANISEEEHPFTVLMERATEAVTAGIKDKDWERKIGARRQAAQEVAFLYHLHLACNSHAAQEIATARLRLRALVGELRLLLYQQAVHHSTLEVWRYISDETPFPAAPEDAAALEAARRHAVETWELFEQGDTVESWVMNQYLDERMTHIPYGAYCARRGTDPFGQRLSDDEVRALFEDEAAYQAFMAGEHFSYGVAGVTDDEFEDRRDQVMGAFRRLATDGTVRAGRVVELSTVPISMLREAPLVDGKWLDRYVVELAEAGAILVKQGFTFEIADDNHPLAWDPAMSADGAEAPRETVEKALVAARENLKRCPAKTRKIDGRPYLAFDGYRGWRSRKLKGQLAVSDGVGVASWNAWVAEQGEQGLLAGVRVETFNWSDDFYPTAVCADADEAERRAARRKRELAELRVWSLNESGVDGFWRKQLPVVGETFDEATRRWRADVEDLMRDLFEMREALAIIARTYFNGRDSLFPSTRAEFEAAMHPAGTFSEMYEQAFAEVRRRYTSAVTEQATDAREHPIDVDALALSARDGARLAARRLVDTARAEAFTFMGDAPRARAVIAPHVFPPEEAAPDP